MTINNDFFQNASTKEIDLVFREIGFRNNTPTIEPRLGFWDQLYLSWEDTERYQPNSLGQVIANSSGRVTSKRYGATEEFGWTYRIYYSDNLNLSSDHPKCDQNITQSCWHDEAYWGLGQVDVDSRRYHTTIGPYTTDSDGNKQKDHAYMNLLSDLYQPETELVFRMWMRHSRHGQEHRFMSNPTRFFLPTEMLIIQQQQHIKAGWHNTYTNTIEQYQYRISHTQTGHQTEWTSNWITICDTDLGEDTTGAQTQTTALITSTQPHSTNSCGGDPAHPLQPQTPYRVIVRAVDQDRTSNPYVRNYNHDQTLSLQPPPTTLPTTPTTAGEINTPTTPGPTNTQPTLPPTTPGSTTPGNTQPTTPNPPATSPTTPTTPPATSPPTTAESTIPTTPGNTQPTTPTTAGEVNTPTTPGPTNTQPTLPPTTPGSTTPGNTQPTTPPATQPPTPAGGGGIVPPPTGNSQPTTGETATDQTQVRTVEGFTDTNENGHQANIIQLAEIGVTRGCNPPENSRFCPDRAVTRAEMATFLVRAFELPTTEEDPFEDTAGNIHRSNINRMAAAGISRGCNPPTNTRFCPDRAVTRGEMATFMTRVLELEEEGSGFDDTQGNVHANNIRRFAEAGITRGCNPPSNTRYCPDRAVTRAEMATFLVRSTALNSR